MSDMLAVLLGAGGNAASKVMAALSGGKSDASGAHGRAGVEDPFMAVLFSKMNVVEGKVGQPIDDALAAEETEPAVVPDIGVDDKAQLPLKPLELALLHVHWPPGDAGDQVAQTVVQAAPVVQAAQVAQVAQAVQSALAAPAVFGQNPTNPMNGGAGDAALAGLALSPEMAAGKDAKRAVQSRSVATATVAPAEVNPKTGAAEAAEDGQLLPPGRGGAELPLQSRTETLQSSVPISAAGAVVQGLAAHFQAAGVDAVGVVSGQANQAIATGIGHGMGAMADMQGRSVPSGVHMAIDVPVRSPMFPQELGERIVWLSTRQGQMADIALNPPHLGPLEVKLSLSGGEAGAQFFSPHAQVRDAIEAALPRLREMMAEAGVTLGQAQVRDEAFTRQESLAHGDASANVGGSDSDEQSLRAGGPGVVRSMGLGLVDVFV